MKIRSGFVSNSSSSSFIIASKGDLFSNIKEAFKLPDNYPLHSLVEGAGKVFIQCLEDGWQKGVSSVEEYLGYLEDIGYDVKNLDIDKKEFAKITSWLNEGYTIYFGEFSSEEVGLESVLCETGLNYFSEKLIITHEGGY